jgi:hypothetical protein
MSTVKVKREAAAQKARDGRTKKLLLILVPALAIVAVIQGPKLLSLVSGGSGEETAQVEETAPDASTEVPIAESGTGGEALAPVTELTDSDVPARAEPDQLTTLSSFAPNSDPFRSEAIANPAVAEADPGATTGETDPTATEGSTNPDGNGDAPTGDVGLAKAVGGTAGQPTGFGGSAQTSSIAAYGAAQLSVNDVSERIRVATAFPTSSPVFRLVRVSARSVSIGLVTGSFSTNSSTVEVELGETRKLVSQPDGTTFRVKLIRVLATS